MRVFTERKKPGSTWLPEQNIYFYSVGIPGRFIKPKLSPHPHKPGSVVSLKAFKEILAECDAFLILGLNPYDLDLETDRNKVKSFKLLVERMIKIGQPYYEVQ